MKKLRKKIQQRKKDRKKHSQLQRNQIEVDDEEFLNDLDQLQSDDKGQFLVPEPNKVFGRIGEFVSTTTSVSQLPQFRKFF